jgi:hypothetical protein
MNSSGLIWLAAGTVDRKVRTAAKLSISVLRVLSQSSAASACAEA